MRGGETFYWMAEIDGARTVDDANRAVWGTSVGGPGWYYFRAVVRNNSFVHALAQESAPKTTTDCTPNTLTRHTHEEFEFLVNEARARRALGEQVA